MCNLQQIFFLMYQVPLSQLMIILSFTCHETQMQGIICCRFATVFSGSEHMIYGLLALRNLLASVLILSQKENISFVILCHAHFFFCILGGKLSEKSASIWGFYLCVALNQQAFECLYLYVFPSNITTNIHLLTVNNVGSMEQKYNFIKCCIPP